MMPAVTILLRQLPPFEDDHIYVYDGDQGLVDIKREVMEAHKEFAPHYDTITNYFIGSTTESICRHIFDFMQANLPYTAESETLQTTRSPAALLTMATLGFPCDCKHYSGFTAGVLDALNRTGQTSIKWAYRFASYKPNKIAAEHVYVVVLDDWGNEIWIDPAPVAGKYERAFNDRYAIPEHFEDKLPTMSIVRISGIGRLVSDPYMYYTDSGGMNEGLYLDAPVNEPSPTAEEIKTAYVPIDIYTDPVYDEPVFDPVFDPPIYQTAIPAPGPAADPVHTEGPLPVPVQTLPTVDLPTNNFTSWIKAHPTESLLGALALGISIYYLTKKNKA